MPPEYYVYAISSERKKYIYVGISENPERRIFQHNSGYEKTTRPYVPFRLILVEPYPDRIAARAREKFLKSGVGRKYLYALVNR